ncbi:MAG: 1-acyl-sn-glycerol-3-phosphate acyltransferase [Actinobacteria bacterium]|nr:1-acyl-sn-glycerol-3-phosphate acyltransferase [Actinomycetota bacterium]
MAERRVRVSRDPLSPPTRGQRLLYRAAWYLLVVVGKAMFRVEIVGRDKLPRGRPFLLAPVHRSYLDFAFVVAAGSPGRRLRYLAKDTLWKGPLGRAWEALGAVPVHRGSADREALRACIGIVEREPLVIFPEGTRQLGPDVKPLFDGVAYVQSRTGVPIVPVGIGGSEAAWPKGRRIVRPHKIVVVIGDPIEAPEAEGARARRQSVRHQTARVREEIQRLFDDAQRRAGTPNAG